jgi:hypothetical protein
MEFVYLLAGVVMGFAMLGLWMRRRARLKREAWRTLYVGPIFLGVDAAHTKVTLKGES